MSDPQSTRVRGTLSVVIPAYAQERWIGNDLERIQSRLEEISADHEIVVVVDGVVDRTEELARAVAGPSTRVEVLEENRGKGFAVRHGILGTRGQIVGFIDAGGDIDPTAIATAARTVDRGLADIAVGSKRHPLSSGSYPFIRRVYSWGYQLLIAVLFSLKVRDTQVGIKFMTRDVVDKIFPDLCTDGFSFDVELLALARRRGFVRVEECPVTIVAGFPSTINTRTAWEMLIDTLRTFVRMRIKKSYD